MIGGTGSLSDISAPKLAEEKLLKANRFYTFISHINEVIIRFREKEKLLNEVCSVAIEYGKFQMAWIGLIDLETKSVKPVTYVGVENGYLTTIKPISVSDMPEGRGPTGTAIRNGDHFVCEDIANDPRMKVWRKDALDRGYRSSIALPLKQFGKVFGAFSLYSPIPHFFDQEEIELLDEVANNISFAIDAIATEKEKRDLYTNLELKVNERTAQLAATNEILLKEIEERKRAEIEISKARIEAEKANLAKSEFLSRMSHELRTPMNSILGFAQLLEMGELNSGQKKGISHILRSGRHLLDLINEVLDISRIEAGRLSLSLEPVQLNTIINEMMDTVRPQATQRQLSLQLVNLDSDPLFVMSDRQRLKQILLNLLNNAIKYNSLGGSLIIKTEKLDQLGDIVPVRISVSDTGLGIAEEDLPKLFSPFERIGAEKSATEGTGLGLTVVKKLTDALGGKTGVESKPGEGSTFWIELPNCENGLKKVEKSGILSKMEFNSDLRPGKILYIEDNESNIELIEQIIFVHRSNIQLITNTYGKRAVDLAITHQPDLILLDLNLPDIYGAEVLELLKAEERTCSIPVVVISADAMPQQLESLISAGAKSYLTKPIDISIFLTTVDKYI